jgi:tetratricopeptide (TPR) repeat protein
MRRLCYALLTAALVGLLALFGARAWTKDVQTLPIVEAPTEVAGQSCAAGLQTARELTWRDDLDPARRAYLWLIQHCEGSPVLPDALLEAGALFGFRMQRPAEARRAYEAFLRRFPDQPGADDATYHLAQLEIDAGEYAPAVAHLTALAERDPNGPHEESAKFLAARAAEMLAADRRAQRTATGQVAALVPNNLLSMLALLVAVGPSAIQTLRQAHRESTSPTRWRWMIPGLVIGLTLLNSVINNIDNARRNTLVMEKLDRLLESESGVPGDR